MNHLSDEKNRQQRVVVNIGSKRHAPASQKQIKQKLLPLDWPAIQKEQMANAIQENPRSNAHQVTNFGTDGFYVVGQHVVYQRYGGDPEFVHSYAPGPWEEDSNR